MRINNNIHALNAYRNLSNNQFTLGRNMERLSSGLRINRAADDAAGLAVSEKMRSQIRGLAMAERNSLDGISLIQTAEGALNEVHSMLQRMKELSVQAANGTNDIADRREIQKEINQLLDEIDRISKDTEFNTKKLLDGSLAQAMMYEATGNALLTSVDTTGFNQIKFVLEDGTEKEITLAEIDYDGSGPGKMLSDLVADIQAQIDLDNDLTAAEVKVALNGNKLVFSARQEVELQEGNPDALVTKLGFANNTKLSPSSSADSTYRMAGTTLDLTTPVDTTTNNILEFEVNGTLISLTLSTETYDGSGPGKMLSDLVADIQTQIDGELNADWQAAGVKVDVDASGALVFTSKQPLTLTGGTAVTELGLNIGPLTEIPSSNNFGIALQIGANEGQQLKFEINAVSTRTLGFGFGTIAYDPNDPQQAKYGNLASLRIDPATLETATSGGVLTNADAGKAMTILEKSILQVSSERSKMGAIQNRLEHAINNLSTTRENLTAAESRIRDTDMAKEMTEFTKNNIKNQAATAMLAQANQLPQGILQLLQ